MIISSADQARFWSSVDKDPGHGPNGDCWLWTGTKSNGYGYLRINGKSRRANRVTWEIFHDRDLGDALACHTCDNRSCVNPAHIYAGSKLTNARDAKSRGRMRGFSAENATRTHCPSGHPYDGANLIINKRGYRICRLCAQRSRSEYKLRAKAQVSALLPPTGNSRGESGK